MRARKARVPTCWRPPVAVHSSVSQIDLDPSPSSEPLVAVSNVDGADGARDGRKVQAS